MATREHLYIVPPPPPLEVSPPLTLGDTVEAPPAGRDRADDILAIVFIAVALGLVLGSLLSRPVCDLLAWVLG